ncbi:hypothetical protein BU17DRAFT_67634 [Hysterangium stoloniferum]|nr:hypothetical protein BU17DRAFT_67634 [Hysterangium stoloniferum]
MYQGMVRPNNPTGPMFSESDTPECSSRKPRRQPQNSELGDTTKQPISAAQGVNQAAYVRARLICNVGPATIDRETIQDRSGGAECQRAGEFPGTSGLEVHNRFRDTQASIIHPRRYKCYTRWHSLGAAISLIDTVYLPLHLPMNIRFKFVGYGLPRVGNPAFAQYLDAHFPDLTHINNKKDLHPFFLNNTISSIEPDNGTVVILTMVGRANSLTF